MRRSTCFALLLLLWSLPAWGHDDDDARNRVSFQVGATREVANDWTTARLAVVAEGKEPAVVAAEVNSKMKTALAIVKRTKGLEFQSGAYVSHPIQDDGRIVRWQARQELRVETGDVERLSAVLGALQKESVLLEGIEFSIRSETRRQIENELIGEALDAFRERASHVAQKMKAADWSLIALSVGDSTGPMRRVSMRAEAGMLSSAKSAPPVFEAGTSDLEVRVDGTVELE